MLSEPRYNTGVRPLWDAMFVSLIIGDSFCLPVANQNWLSHTQKSSSLCVAIACLSVMIISSILLNFLPILFKCSDIGSSFFSGVPNVMSVNVGAADCKNSSIIKSGSVVSSVLKSLGNGISWISDAGVVSIGCATGRGVVIIG